MKYIKKVTIAIGALALVAAFSASAASAKTVICSSPETTCAPGSIQPAGSYLTGSMNTSEMPETGMSVKTGLGTYTCQTGLLGVKSSAEAGNPLPGTGEPGILGCGKECQLSLNSAPATMVATTNGSGTVTFGSSEKHQSVTLNCGGGLVGTFGAASVPFQLNTAAEKGTTLSATNVSLNWESGSKFGGAGKPVTLNMTLRVAGAYLGNVPYTVICSSPETTCAPGNIQPAGRFLPGAMNTSEMPETGLSLKMSSLWGTSNCQGGLIGAKSTAEAGNPLPGTSESTGLNCTWAACGKAEISFKSPTPVTMVATGSGNGTVTFGNSKEHQSVTINCSGIASGTYGAASVPFQFNAAKSTLTATNVPLSWESGFKFGGGENPVTLNATLWVWENYLGSI